MTSPENQDCERLASLQESVEKALREADRLGLSAVAIDLDRALNRLKESKTVESP